MTYVVHDQNLLRLHEATSHLEDPFRNHTRQFIEVGEPELALDGIADAHLRNNAPMPPDLFALFETMAEGLGCENDPEYAAVAELRARGPLPAP